MPTLSDLKRQADIKYIARDFDALVKELKIYLKYQFPDSYKDFSDTSGGMAFLELVAYVGDILNFYIDKQFNELFLDTAQERKNLISLAKNLGYNVRGKVASVVNLNVTATYSTTGSNTANLDFVLLKESEVTTTNGIRFETINDIDFSSTSNRTITINGNETIVSVSGIKAVNGDLKTINIDIRDPIPFLKIMLPDPNVLEVFSVTSSDIKTWYQADYLAQETQFFGVPNIMSISSIVPYILTLRQIPRRFIIEKDENNFTSLIFGAGTVTTSDSDFIPNPSDFILPATLRGVEDGFIIDAIDTENFLNTGTLGVAPNNIVLTIKYRVGGGTETNIASNTLQTFNDRKIRYLTNISISAVQRSQTESSIIVNNEEPASGGKDEETNEQLRWLASSGFAAQNRVITIQDYIVRTMTMPANFGVPFRVQARKDTNSDFGIQIIILSKNADNNLIKTPDQLKINVGNYLNKFKSINDTLNIIDGKIININILFGIVVNSMFNKQNILANCLEKLKHYFRIDNWQMGQSISLSEITTVLMSVQGVNSVTNIQINNLYGTINDSIYSNDTFDINGHTKNNIIKINYDSMFEIKYPDIDIMGGIVE